MTAPPLIMIVSVWSKLQLGIDNKDYHHHHHYHLQHCQYYCCPYITEDKLHLYSLIAYLKSLIYIQC